MTSPRQDGDSPVPNPMVLTSTVGADEGHATEQAVQDALACLNGVSELPVAEHVERFEAVHTTLTDALNKAENLLSGTNSNGS